MWRSAWIANVLSLCFHTWTPEYGTRFEILGVRVDVSLPDMRTCKGGVLGFAPPRRFWKVVSKMPFPAFWCENLCIEPVRKEGKMLGILTSRIVVVPLKPQCNAPWDTNRLLIMNLITWSCSDRKRLAQSQNYKIENVQITEGLNTFKEFKTTSRTK